MTTREHTTDRQPRREANPKAPTPAITMDSLYDGFLSRRRMGRSGWGR